jgi:hypothetical protein
VNTRALIVLAVLPAGVLAGCGSAAGFAQRTEHTCSSATNTIAALAPPVDPAAGLRYALDRYSAVELAVATVTDSTLPAGSTGADLRQGWLRPARASLSTSWPALARLQVAVKNGDAPAAATAFTAAAAAGTGSVDTALLAADALPSCETLFSATPVTPGW